MCAVTDKVAARSAGRDGAAKLCDAVAEKSLPAYAGKVNVVSDEEGNWADVELGWGVDSKVAAGDGWATVEKAGVEVYVLGTGEPPKDAGTEE